MTKQNQHWLTSRKIVERIRIECELKLLTPAHFGSGDADSLTDMTLLRDAVTGAALLPGASIAGALRNYWRERTGGYGMESGNSDLFGARRGRQEDMSGAQSLLIVEDAIGAAPQIELREGVKIDGATRTAEAKKLFDMETLRAGTIFKLRFELSIPAGMARETLCRDLAVALNGFETGEIGLGARKRRGLGECEVGEWRVWRHDLTRPKDLLDWLAVGREWNDRPVTEAQGVSLAQKLGVQVDEWPDKRERFEIEATFALDGSLMVRSGSGQADVGPDAVHLRRAAYGSDEPGEPIVPGTSLAGVLRARALKIARTLAADQTRAVALIDGLFGIGPEDRRDKRSHSASRVMVHESAIQGTRDLVQNRIRVDRFTGGAMDNYLFDEMPVFGNETSDLKLRLVMRQPKNHEIGLALLLLKDLWTGDLPMGGESGIGRGRLKGNSAKLKRVIPQDDRVDTWSIARTPDGLRITGNSRTDAEADLQAFVDDLNRFLAGG